MAEVFHVARRVAPDRRSHSPGTVLGNIAPQPSTYPGALDAIQRRFPAGVSNHGAQYLAGWPADNGPGFVAEALCEAVRLAEARDKPSRMTSWFAAETLEDARAFVTAFRTNTFVDIWRADGEVVHRANMALLQALNLPVVAALEQASAYWRGEQGPVVANWEVLVAPGMRLLEVVETTGNKVQTMPGVGTALTP